ncbi:MAG: class I SAM-dependent methyltransferase [Thermoplasmata archaeon]
MDRAHWKTTYDATPYEELPWFDPEPSPVVREAVRSAFFVPSGRVLDIGCGAGSNVLFLARSGFVVHGLDLSPGAVRAARRRAAEAGVVVHVHAGDVLALPFFGDSFSAALDHGCFHTLPIDRRAEYAAEVARVMVPGARFLLSWIGRESTAEMGPPHRPSLAEVVETFEPLFLVHRTECRERPEESLPTTYVAWMVRRSSPQPPPR